MGKVNVALNAKRCALSAGDYEPGCAPVAQQSHAPNPLVAIVHRANIPHVSSFRVSSNPSGGHALCNRFIAVAISRPAAGALSSVVERNKKEGRSFKRSLPNTTYRKRLAGIYSARRGPCGHKSYRSPTQSASPNALGISRAASTRSLV